MEAEFVPLRKSWSSLEMLADVGRSDLEAAGDIDRTVEVLLFDMNTEYDAVNLSAHFDREREAGRIAFSPEFLAFREAWLGDECNHYEGYRYLYGLCTAKSAETLHQEVVSRPVNFGPVAEFLGDEFSILMVIAYDELFTVQSCTQDFPLFSAFAKPHLLDWIKLVARDEVYHYHNAMEVIRRKHPHRMKDAPQFLDRLVSWDLDGGAEYGATFVLDHEEDRYTKEELLNIKDKILNLLNQYDTLED